jgi:hypothetical protein
MAMIMIKRMTFWTKVQLTIQAVLSLAQLSLIFGDSEHIYNVFITAGQLVALIIPIWIEDKNNDGNVDLFEKEVTVKVKSDAPIQVETSTETKTP